MLREAYLLLKQRVSSDVAALKHVDWNLQQLNMDGEDPVPTTPALYLGFNPITWSSHLSSHIQRGVLEFTATLVTDTAYGDDRDMIDTTYINHLSIERAVYKSFQGWRGRISMLPQFADLAGTNEDVWILETIERINTIPHNILDSRVQTTQTFRCNFFDYSALPQYQEALATLNIIC